MGRKNYRPGGLSRPDTGRSPAGREEDALVRVARKTLLEEPLRFGIAVGGVALSIVLILVLGGMYAGVNEQVTAYVDHAPAELVVAQTGLRNFLGVRSSLPPAAEDEVRGVDGVERATPVIAQYVVLELRGRKEFTLLVGFEPQRGGGPWDVVSGTGEVRDGEVVLDQALARLRDLRVGDHIDILGESFEIAGLSAGTSSFMTGTAFVTYADAARLVNAQGPSFVLATLDSGSDAGEVADRIERAAAPVTVSTRPRIAANDIELFAAILKGPVGFMVVTAFLVGVSLVGLTTYTATIERAKDYGALKAIGASNRKLYGIVVRQAAISAVTGSVLGVALAFVVAEVIERANPRFLVAIQPAAVAGVLGVALAMGVLAALAPALALARIDPAIAFRRGA